MCLSLRFLKHRADKLSMSPVMLLSAPGSAVYLTTYDTVRASTLAEQGSLGATLFAAVSAELVSGVVFTPMVQLR